MKPSRDLGGEGRMGPVFLAARRHHVGVTGKAEMRSARADAGEQVFDVGRAFRLEDQALADEAVAESRFSRTVSAPPSAGVTDRQRIRSCRMGTDRSGVFFMESDHPQIQLTTATGIGAVLVGAFGAAQETAFDQRPECSDKGIEQDQRPPARLAAVMPALGIERQSRPQKDQAR